jgi:hypothetical protein
VFNLADARKVFREKLPSYVGCEAIFTGERSMEAAR